MRLKNKRAIITGGSSGIGAAIVDVFITNGCEVHVLDLSSPLTEKANFHNCDISDHQVTKNVIQSIVSKYAVDILVNNAGIGFVGDLLNTSEEDLDRVYRVNVKGVYNCMHACLPSMLTNGGGVILNMASVVATVGIPDRFAYTMSKGAVLTMTYSVAKDYVDKNIRCNSISPGRVHTPFVDDYLAKNYPGEEQVWFDKLAKTQPIGRMAKPEEIANLAAFLCSDEAKFITGTDYPIDGGFIKLNT